MRRAGTENHALKLVLKIWTGLSLTSDPVYAYFSLSRFKSRTSCLNCWEFYYQQNVTSKYWSFWCNAIYWPRSRFSVSKYFHRFCFGFSCHCLILMVTFKMYYNKYGSTYKKNHQKMSAVDNDEHIGPCAIQWFAWPVPEVGPFQLVP